MFWAAAARKSLTEADLKKARSLLRSGDYADEVGVSRQTLWWEFAA
jgi:hypothetical protein